VSRFAISFPPTGRAEATVIRAIRAMIARFADLNDLHIDDLEREIRCQREEICVLRSL
jgi:hypothetical protein